MTKQPQDKPTPDEDALLAPYFAASRAAAEDALPESLQARLMQDAMAQIPAPPLPRAVERGYDRGYLAALLARLGRGFSGFGRQSVRLLGGTPGVAVVSAAGLAGVLLGLALPEPASELLGFIGNGAVSADDSSIWAQAARDLGEDEALLALLDSF